jgi:polysaccharide export outer membrane protein
MKKSFAILCALCAVTVFFIGASYAQSDLPITHYEQIAAQEKEAFQLYQQGDFAKAREFFEKVLGDFQDFKSEFGSWEMAPLVEVKIKECKRYLGEINSRFAAPAQETIPQERKPDVSPAVPMTTQQYVAFLEDQVAQLNAELLERKKAFKEGYTKNVAEDLQTQKEYLNEQFSQERDSLAKEIDALKKALADSTEQNNDLRLQLDTLTRDFEDSKDAGSTSRAKRSRIASLKGKVNALSRDVRAKTQENEKLLAQTRSYTKQIDALNTQLAQFKEKYKHAPAEKPKPQAKGALSKEENRQVKEIQKQVREYEAQITALNKDLVSTRRALEQKVGIMERLTEDTIKLRQELSDRKAEVKDNVARLVKLDREIRTREQELAKSRQTIARLEAERNARTTSADAKTAQEFQKERVAYEQKIRALNAELAKVMETLKAQSRETEKLASDNAALQGELKNNAQGSTARTAALQKENDSLKDEIKALESNLARMKSDLEEMSAAYKNVQTTRTETAKDAQKAHDLQKQVKVQGQSLEAKDLVIDRLTDENKTLAGDLREIKADFGRQGLALSKLERQNEDLRSRLADSQDAFAGMKQDLKDARAQLKTVNPQDLRDLKEDNQRLKEVLDAAQKDLLETQKIVEMLNKDKDALGAELEGSRDTIKELRVQLARAQEQHAFQTSPDEKTISEELYKESERVRKNQLSKLLALQNTIDSLEASNTQLTKELKDLESKITASIAQKEIVPQETVMPQAAPTQEAIAAAPRTRTSEKGEYRVNPGDILEVTVYNEPDLTKTVQVSSEGYISYPLLGKVEVGGMTVFDISEKMRVLLAKDYLVNPQVSVSIRQFNTISILGEVEKPGSYELKGNMTIIEALALAGGLTQYADPTNAKVVRNENGEKTTIAINIEDVTKKGDKSKDIVLDPSDVIVIPEAAKISILGQVMRPGSYGLKSDMTVVDAIALAGGLTQNADPTNVKVVRSEHGIKTTTEINVEDVTKRGDKSKDVALKAEDVVVIPEAAKISILGQVMRPGSYELKSNMTVVEAIALAGGFSKYAEANGTKIIRSKDGKETTIRVRVKDITDRGDKSKDVALEPGDVIVVPESFF